MNSRQKTGKPARRVTMSDICRLAGGCHPSTVSLALRNHPGISEPVRTLIQKIARKIGYRRDPLLDAFNLHRTQGAAHKDLPVIAFVTDFPTISSLGASPRHRALWQGATTAAQTLFHRVEFFSLTAGNMSAKRLDAVLRARGINGMVVAALRTDAKFLDFAWERFSTVKIGCGALEPPGYTVEAALLPGVRLALRHMYSLGYRHVGLVTMSGSETQRNDLLQAGVLCEHDRLPRAERVHPLILGSSAAAVRDWLSRFEVDAILAEQTPHQQLISMIGRGRVKNLGWACTDVAGAASNVAGMVVDYEALGSVAVEQVVGLLRAHQRGFVREVSTTFVPVAWRNGETLPTKTIVARIY